MDRLFVSGRDFRSAPKVRPEIPSKIKNPLLKKKWVIFLSSILEEKGSNNDNDLL